MYKKKVNKQSPGAELPVKTCNYVKGCLISKSFQPNQKKFGGWSQSEELSEIKPHLSQNLWKKEM